MEKEIQISSTATPTGQLRVSRCIRGRRFNTTFRGRAWQRLPPFATGPQRAQARMTRADAARAPSDTRRPAERTGAPDPPVKASARTGHENVPGITARLDRNTDASAPLWPSGKSERVRCDDTAQMGGNDVG